MDWEKVVLQATAVVGGIAALVAILNGVYEFREHRQKRREQRRAEAPAIPDPPSESLQVTAAKTTPSDQPHPAPLRRPTNLPSQPAALVGREEECAELEGLLLRPDVRLVTLTGPAGVGKTRLALEVASSLLEHYPDGVFFVPFAPVATPDRVVPTIARVLDVREQGNQPLMGLLKDHLQAKRLLLVLDNFEQLTAAAHLVAELIAAAPQLSMIVTSREVLHLYGEHVFVVKPLALPAEVALSSGDLVSVVSHNEAVRLFVTRAQAADSSFALTSENVLSVADIVRRLDGLPLAIELAAARVRLLPPRVMLERLAQATGGSSLQLLTGGPRDLPARQQTLRNTIAWSYDLLDEAEQWLFQRLAVFSGGWTLDAAEAVAGASGASGNVFDGLDSLISKSLIWQTPHQGRFMMLQTIRDYALEQLVESGQADGVREAHARWVLALVEQAEPELYGPDQAAWLERLDAEQENLRAALDWLLAGRNADLALRLAGCLSWYWNLRGRVSEGRTWLEAALAAAP